MRQKAVIIAPPLLLALVVSLAAMFFMLSSADAHDVTDTATGPLDHFLCYTDKQPVSPDAIVGLQDQFDEAGLVEAQVLDSRLFCNPANKDHKSPDGTTQGATINHIENHLVLYSLRHPKVPSRAVKVSNQFGEQQLKVGQAVGLFVPTAKSLPDGSDYGPTTDLDHFKCYNVKGHSVKQKVALGDQFIPMTPAGVYDPVLLCNPVIKVHKQVEFRPQHPGPDNHLVCYKVRVKQSTRESAYHDLLLTNQFEELRPTVVYGPNLLRVPSLKQHLDGGNGGKGGRGVG